MQHLYDKIISFIRTNGPSLPTQIAKVIEKDSFYAGALLSDLLNRKIISITTAKIGGSPLYYLPEQKEQLAKLYDHLPLREKEAYALLQEKKVLKDSELQPAIRVACQMLKDFAVPFEHNNQKMWRWHVIPEHEIQQLLQPQPPEVKPQRERQLVIEQKQPSPKPRISSPDEFSTGVNAFLSHNKIAVQETLSQRKNKEMIMTAKIPSSIGELEMLIIAKNKKKISLNDLALAHQKGQSRKLPTLFLTTGELSKKTLDHVEKNLKGLLLVRKL